ncbi:uncharacterized protein LOC141676975 isoform X1 [Apium graveolens]|uniref:uncharacterized protein LOC141676975 isoform X1 n=1 Tax=Apium graveolens TaxID=4045 RepID=UPI003D79D8BB
MFPFFLNLSLSVIFAVEEPHKIIFAVEEPHKTAFQNVHRGHPAEALEHFLKAGEENVSEGHKMLVDCLNWRVENKIDDILALWMHKEEEYHLMRKEKKGRR